MVAMPLPHFFLLALVFIIIPSSSSYTDCDVLAAMKQEFEFPEPGLSSWDVSNSSSFCSWIGIRCLQDRVVSIDLTDMNLGGYVTPLISKLDRLSHISLAGNNLTGEIEISNLSRLSYLNISGNLFSGGLEWNYSSIRSLEVLDAYDNNFTSPLPSGLLKLEKLKHLDLGGNFFFGEIPESYGNFVELEHLSLAGNDLHGRIPSSLGNLTKLRAIYLGYYNMFEGGIPIQFGNLIDLVHLDLSSCDLDGVIPPQLGNLISLDTVYLHLNRFSGRIPSQLGNLTRLVNLDLSANSLTGEIPVELCNLSKLKLLNLFMNKFHGSVPEFVADLPELETIAIWKNNFTGRIPKNLGRNQNLKTIDLSSNKLTGAIPEDLCSSNHLRILILFKNFLLGTIPESLGRCYTLSKVRLGENYFNGSIPMGFIYLPELNLLELHNNVLAGSIPENDNVPSRKTKLTEMNLSNNILSGSLPASISNFTSLQILLLSGNRLSGPISESIGDLHQILKLDLSRNSFSGETPHQIGNCSHLTYLDFSENNISGEIPEEISDLHNLNYMNLSRNYLTSSLPKSIGSIKSLTNADFSFNDLSGEVPNSGQFSFFNASSFAGNRRLCGGALPNSCGIESRRNIGDFKLIFAIGMLICSLIFVAGGIRKTMKRNSAWSNSWRMTPFQKLHFTVSDVLECIKDGNVIGRGGAGVVYHGKMPDGVEIAVKKLLGFGGNSHDRGFRAEIQTLGNIRHRNIVRLLAFCSDKETNLLVYEYMRNGSVGEALHGRKKGFLGWNLRYKIAMESARGLCYLHHDCSPLIVHRDVKSNNILLDSNFETHVADFGLAKFLVDGGSSECMSAIAGSYGYIAPEYAYTLRVDEKSDVYSFGVVLLELITGRRPVGDFGEGVDIVLWVTRETRGLNENDTKSLLDPRLADAVPMAEAKHLLFIAMLCVQADSMQRPTMREVVQMLSEYDHYSPMATSRSHSPPVSVVHHHTKKKEQAKNYCI